MKFTAKDVLVPAFKLFAICLVVTAILGVTNLLTVDLIAEAAAATAEQSKMIVLPEADAFEDIDENTYVGTSGGEIVGYVFSTESSGYGGAVTVMTGISVDGDITGVVLLDHEETPGLGANAEKDSFTDQYQQSATELEVVKTEPVSDGEILAITGATITSTAVTNAVNSAVEQYEEIMGGA